MTSGREYVALLQEAESTLDASFVGHSDMHLGDSEQGQWNILGTFTHAPELRGVVL